MTTPTEIKNLGQLKASGYNPRGIKEEIQANLIEVLRSGKHPFQGIYGYENSVIPAIERGLLAAHDLLLLGLRGQAKTRIARQMVGLLDEYIPVIEGSELNEDPLHPLLETSRARIAELGDELPVSWVHRSERFFEKLATPDTSVADLIGDIDPIKAANNKLSFSD
ncbi:MAG: magnesium chelatase, partial [Schleiferiaceae bacterium]